MAESSYAPGDKVYFLYLHLDEFKKTRPDWYDKDNKKWAEGNILGKYRPMLMYAPYVETPYKGTDGDDPPPKKRHLVLKMSKSKDSRHEWLQVETLRDGSPSYVELFLRELPLSLAGSCKGKVDRGRWDVIERELADASMHRGVRRGILPRRKGAPREAEQAT